jgi:AcrR family transcriptional regulator
MARTKTDSRERIIEAASELFFRQGYQGTSVDEIIDKCGLSKPTVYNYFPTKEALCVEYLKERRKTVIQKLRAAIRAGKTAEDRFMVTIHFVKEDMLRTNYRGCGFFNMVAEIVDFDNPVVLEARDFVERFRDEMRESVLDLKDSDPAYADMDTNRVTESYYLIIGGAIMAGQELQQEWVFDRAVEDVERLMIGLK